MDLIEDFIRYLESKGQDPNQFGIHGLTNEEETELYKSQFIFGTNGVELDFVSFLDLFLWERMGRSDFRVGDSWLSCYSKTKHYAAYTFTIEDVVADIERQIALKEVERELDKMINPKFTEVIKTKAKVKLDWIPFLAGLFVGFMIIFFLASF